MNPADVAKYLRELADSGGVSSEADMSILHAAANIVLIAVGEALGVELGEDYEPPPKGE